MEGTYIQHVPQKVCEVAASVEKFMPEHVIFELVEQMRNKEEEVRTEVEKVVKIVEGFQNKISASHYMEQ